MIAHILPCHIEASIFLWIFSSFGVLWAGIKTFKTTILNKTKRQETKQDDDAHC